MRHIHRPKQKSVAEELFEYRSLERKRLKLAMVITGAVMVIEVVGGLLTNSLALISDAGHMFTHFLALTISLGAIACANLPTCHHRTFGFYRMEILAALLNSLFLFAVTFWILFEGIKRIIHPAPVLSLQMLGVAVIGLIVNLITAWILREASRGDLNVKGAFLHIIADTLSSIVIVFGAAVIYFTNWNIIDPILSIGIALVILIWAWGLFRDSVNILLEAAPRGANTDEVSEVLMKEVPEIKEITDLHIWTITSNMHSMTAHIVLKESFQKEEAKAVLSRIKQIVNERFDVGHTTIEVE
jgi:cobalt-zinc-cadmium efflux system protein